MLLSVDVTSIVRDPNSIPLDEITNLELLEKGSFGIIYRGSWRGTTIAIKKLPSGNMSEKLLNEFYQEAEIMKYVRLCTSTNTHTHARTCICVMVLNFSRRGVLI